MKEITQISDIPVIEGGYGIRRRLFFENGYGISVITGSSSFKCNGYNDYEVAVIVEGEDGVEVCYTTEITNDTLGYQTEEEVIAIANRIQNFASLQTIVNLIF